MFLYGKNSPRKIKLISVLKIIYVNCLMWENGAEGKEVALACTEEVLKFIAEVSETGCNNRVTLPPPPPNKTIIPLMNY